MRFLIMGVILFAAAIFVGLSNGPNPLFTQADALQGDDDGLENVALKSYLPDAPDGWTRRNWTKDDTKRMPGLAGVEEEILMTSQYYGKNAIALHVKGQERTFTQLRAQTMWIYEDATGIIEFSILKPNKQKEMGQNDPLSKGPMGLNMNMSATVGSSLRSMQHEKPYAVIHGVMWAERSWDTSDHMARDVPFKFGAKFGDFQLYLRGRDVTEAQMREMMTLVDYDGLNALLAIPLDGVGSQSVPMSEDEQRAYMQQMLDEQRQALREERRDAEIRQTESLLQDMKRLDELGLADQKTKKGLEQRLIKLRKARAEERSEDQVQKSLNEINDTMIAATEKLQRITGDALTRTTDQDQSDTVQATATEEAEPPQITVNRFGNKKLQRRKKGGCGGVNFCKITKD